MSRIYALLLSYYLIGLIAILVINRRSTADEAKARWLKYCVYVIITAGFITAFLFAPLLAIAMGVLIALAGCYELARLPGFPVRRKAALLLVYATLSVFFCMFITRASSFNELPANAYLIVLSFDGFSQISGQLFGGRRIAPRISPGKTYSGFAGGTIMGVATAAFLERRFEAEILIPAFFICIAAFTGDMLASAVKRRAGVKDYSSLIPGHGGVLDRFDSFLFAGALLECYIRFA